MSTSAKRIEDLSPEKRALLMARLAKKRAETAAPDAIVRRADQGSYPLTFGQQRLWFLDQLEPGSPLYSIPAALRLRGAVDIKALEAGLAEIVRRHEVLRSRYVTERGHPVQVIAPAGDSDGRLPVVDLRALPPAEAEAEALRLAAEEAQKPFDLREGPLLRASLLHLADSDYILLLTMHHIVADGWSVGVLTQELTALYSAFVQGAPARLPDLPIQYADFAVWQRERLQGSLREEQIAYWQSRLSGLPPLELPTDRPRPPAQSFAGAHHTFDLPQGLAEALGELSREEGVTLFMTLLAGFQVLLHRYSGQERFGVGTPLAGRTHPEIEPLIGFFVNSLVLCADLSSEPGFRAVLRRAKATTLEAMAHQELPFEMLVEALQVERDMSRTPLFQVMFTLQSLPTRHVDLPGTNLEVLEVETGTAKFDLLLLVTEGPEGLGASFEYNSDLFDAATIERMAGHFTALLAGAVADPEQPVGRLPMLSQAERRQLLDAWNATATPYPRDATIAELFEEQAARRPEATAVIFGDQTLSYGELNARANRLAHYLRRLGLGPDALVGLAMERSLELIVATLAALKAGGAYLPLDPNYPAERLHFMLEDARPLVVLTTGAVDEGRWAGVAGTRAIALDAAWPEIAGEPATNPAPTAQAESLAYVMYTSGSTGRPKGIMITQRNVVRLVKSTNYATLDEHVVFLQFGAVAFDAATLEIWGPLLNGGRLVLFPDSVPDLEALGQTIRAYGVTTMFLTSGLFHQMVEYRLKDLAGLRELMAGGDVVSPAHVQRLLRELPQLRFSNAYGPTENTTFTTHYPVRDPDSLGASVPIGWPIANTTVYILDRHMQPVPVGVPGELYTGGDGVARGYLNRPELTAERFVELELPVSGLRSRLYRTGDLARFRPDGSVEFLGRIDQQVKLRGFRIELGEIEAVLKQHPAVREVAVIVREDQPGVKKLVAYLVTPGEADGPPADSRQPAVAGELREFLKERLPEYMVPAAFVELPSLPLTANGKVDRKALPAPDQSRDEDDETYVAPRSAVERFLAGIWQEVLGIERVGIHDNFFELGGDSLQAAVLTNRIQEDLKVAAHVRALFMAPNIADLARYVEEYYPEAAARLGDETGGPLVAPTAIIAGSAGAGTIDTARVSQIRAIIPPLPPRPMDGLAPTKNPRAVFVLSPPRSGSTLLRTMLAGHSRLFAPPELDLLSFNTLAERRAAFSGDHSFWLEGPIRALMELLNVDAERASQIMAGYEDEQMTVKAFYSRLQGWLGERYLVDKTPVYPLDPAILQRMEEDFDEPYYIHLVRHPHASVYSFMEAKLDHIFFRHPHPFAQRELAELVWIISHEHILSFLRAIPAERQCRLSFEDLVGQPAGEMQRLCEFLGLPFEEGLLKPYEGRRMTDGVRPGAQMVGDFKFYLRNSIDQRAANRWQQFHAEEFLSPISWRIAEQLGYPAPAAADEADEQRATAAGGNADEQRLPAPPRAEPQPIVPAPRDQELPLSFAQQRLWFLDQLDPGSPLYNIPAAMRLRGPLDADTLERSINAIVRRHEVLRTTFTDRDGRAVQVIGPTDSGITLRRLDLGALPAEAQLAEAARLGAEEARQPFDLSTGPLLRASLLRLDDDDHVMLLTMHHIVADGWSTGVIVRELGALYEAFLHGRPDPLPALKVQYADVAAWQRAWAASPAMAEQLAYWKQRLGGPDGRGLPAPLELPADRPRPAAPSYQGRRLVFRWPAELSAQVRAFCRREEATLFMTLLAAFKALLLRYSGQEDISVGTPIANRTRAEIEPLIGFFVNTLVLRTDLSGAPSFRELLARVRETAVEAYAHQELPFEMLVDALQPQRSLNQTPLFQVMFTVQGATFQSLKLPDLTISPLEADSQTAKFDLTVSVVDRADGLWGSIEYSSDLFDQATIERLAGHYQTLLAGAVAAPEQPVARLPLLTPAEQDQLLVAWNTTAAPTPVDRTIHELFAAQAARTPEAVAVAYEGDELSFRELDERANRLAHHLQHLGVGPDTLVGVCVERSVELIVAIMAALKAGGAYLPLDPSYPAERLRLMVADARPRVLLTQRHLAQAGIWAAADALPVVALDADWATVAGYPASAPPSEARPDNLAYVIYTSGSTGTPKGAMIEHRQALNLAAALKARIYDRLPGARLRISLNAPPSFDASVQQIVMLIYGHTLDIIPQDLRLDGAALLAFVRERRLDLLDCVPSQLKLLLDAGLLDGRGWAPRLVLPGGEAIDDVTWRVLAAAPATDFFNVYGPTECAVDSTTISAREAPARASIGRPLPNTQAYILDRHMQPVPVGVPGELYIGGAGVGRGYLNRPELTAERFIEVELPVSGLVSPISGLRSRLYRTGDLARWRPDGNIEFLGRVDYQVKLRGFRIELGEIESVLADHPAIHTALVSVREDTPGVRRLIAYYSLAEGAARPTTAELRAHLQARLPDYMVPAVFVALEEWPRTPNGKIDRQALPAPDDARPELDTGYAAPTSPAEETLAAIWGAVLGLAQVGVHDNFFALGGDSILSIQVIARARQAGLHLTPRQLFQHPTVAALAAVAGTTRAVVAEQGPVTGPAPLTPIQRWFFAQELPEPHHWNQALLLTVARPLDPALLTQAVGALLAHHDALRLRFRRGPAGWQQRFDDVTPAVDDVVHIVRLGELPAEEQSAAIAERAAELQASLDLERGPLLRVAAFDLGAGRAGRLLLVIHHLAVDGVSWRVLVEDLQTAYGQLAGGAPVRLPAKTTSFQHWAERLAAHAEAAATQGELGPWLAAREAARPLPVDLPGDDNSEASARSVRVALDPETTRALLQDVPAAYGTEINDALLTALAQTLCGWTGGQTALVALEGHGREELFEDVDLTRTVGWFTTLYPVRLSLAGAPEVGAALRSVKEQLRAIPRRGIGYGLLRYLSAAGAALAEGPEPEVSFNYLGQIDSALGAEAMFGPAPEPIGPVHCPRGRRPYLLEVTGSISEGALRLEWHYSAGLHRAETIEGLAQAFVEALRALVAHCQAPDAVGYTPSDFPDVELSQDALDALLEELG